MSLKTILQNIYNYVDILQTSSSEKVKGWDPKALDNALQWAQYCQQIYVQAQGKPYEDELDQHIRHIAQLPWAIGIRTISLEAMKDAVRTLKQALLSNPHVTRATYEHLISSYGQIEKEPEPLIKDIIPLTQDKYFNDLFQVFFSAAGGSDELLTKNRMQSSAKLLLEHADKLLHQKPSRKQQCEEMLVKKLEYVGSDAEGLEIICMACSVPCLNKEISQQFIMTWLLQKPQCLHVFDLKSDILAEVCLVHFIFFRAYIKYLISLTREMKCNVQEHGTVRYSLTGNHDFTYLLQCLSALAHVGEPVSSATVKTVDSLSKRDNTGLWRKLLIQLQREPKSIKACEGIG